jgi:hypothetical protein
VIRPVAWVSLASLLLLAAPAAGQQQGNDLRGLRQEIEALRQEQAKLRTEIQALRELLQRERAAAPRRQPQAQVSPDSIVLTLGDGPMKGDRNAKLVLVEFTDYQ